MYRINWSAKLSSIKDWTSRKLKQLGNAFSVLKINKMTKKGILILSLVAVLLGTNTLFWWYRSTHGGLNFEKNAGKEQPQEWAIDLDEHFLDEEELKNEYSNTEKEVEREPQIAPNELKPENSLEDDIKAQSPPPVVEQKPSDEKDKEESDKIQSEPEAHAATALSTMAMPAMGKVITTFAVDNLVYSKTLEQWNSHHGIDIAADIGSPIKAVMEGTVEGVVENDPKLGVVVIVDHGGGVKTLYGNLASDKSVKKGQAIKKGQFIGSVGNTAPYESEDPPHLHFEVFKDGKSIDPQQYLPKLN